ncbi:abscisic acid 8'-hydroxylase 4-like [Andrographis paniculata]|uniref:abscisic acid 8'-hydroxylase 4-like n=1 Tax=Andrographis paniculata TaxID=175694 RepID=UPI0021E8A1B8|nr:abscisic acid 8'-hydroxylase 4-like [Andrographis paniculata]
MDCGEALMSMLPVVVPIVCLITAICCCCVVVVFSLKNTKNRKLPPGSMGWPYIGETLQLYSQHPNVFFSTRQKRHGEIFKTHILGCPCVMLASPDAARFVLVTQASLFRPTYPKSKEKLIGPQALFFHQGHYHIRLRKLVQASLSPEALRRLVPGIERLTASALASQAPGPPPRVVNTYTVMKMLSFEVGILAIFGNLEPHYKVELKKNYSVVDRGYNSFPTNLPGSSYRKAVKARKKLSEILSCITKERREMVTEKDDDLLSCLMNWKDDNGEILSEDQIADNIIGVLFAAQDTTASAMTWILKYLHDNPKLLEAVKAEQMGIYRINGSEGGLTWNQTRNMPLTSKVILESLRMATIISFTFREAVTDVEYKGYLIPKGWKVMPLFRNIHHNPDFFADPHKFDPARFEVGGVKANTFMPFGSGVHACPGNDLAKLEMLILVHHLTSRFRYELVGRESGIQYGPFPVPLHGLPATFSKLDDNQD